MKSLIATTLIILTIVVVLSNSYFKDHLLKFQQKSNDISKFHTSGTEIVNTNRWISQNIIPQIDDIEEFNVAQNYIMNFEESLRGSLNTIVKNLSDNKKGIITISLKSKIYRDDVNNLLKLFKLNITNGYVQINSYSVYDNYVEANLDLVKFYKD